MLIVRNSLAFRLVAGAAFWIAAGLLAGAYLLSILFRDYVERSFDARLTVLWNSLYTVSRVDDAGKLQMLSQLGNPTFAQAFSGWYWQISKKGKVIARSRSLWARSLDHKEIGRRPTFFQIAGPEGQKLRVLAQTVLVADKRGRRSVRFTLIVAGNRGELEAELALFYRTLVWLLGALVLILVVAVFIQVWFGLSPLRRIPGALAAIRSGRAKRLTGQFSREVQPLVDEFNKLLDQKNK